MSRKVLVTGGVGFIGAYLVNALIDKGCEVFIVDNLKTIGGVAYKNPNATLLEFDICDPALYEKLKTIKFDTIFHLAAQSAGESSYDDPGYDLLTNSLGTYKIASFAKQSGVKRFIYTSTVAVYGQNAYGDTIESIEKKPDSIYGVSKYSGELFVSQLLNGSSVNFTIFRIFNTYGPGENLNYLKKGMVSIYASYIWRNQPIVVKGPLDRYRDFTYIEDTVDALMLSESCNATYGKVYNLSSGVKTTVRDLLKTMLVVAQKDENYEIHEKEGTPGDTFGFHANIDAIKNDLKWAPKYDLKSGLKKYFDWINKVPVQDDLTSFHPFFMH